MEGRYEQQNATDRSRPRSNNTTFRMDEETEDVEGSSYLCKGLSERNSLEDIPVTQSIRGAKNRSFVRVSHNASLPRLEKPLPSLPEIVPSPQRYLERGFSLGATQ